VIRNNRGGVAVAAFALDSSPSSAPSAAVVGTVMVGVKSPLPTSRVPGLSAWVWGAFLLAAVDRLQLAEGQTVCEPGIDAALSLIRSI